MPCEYRRDRPATPARPNDQEIVTEVNVRHEVAIGIMRPVVYGHD
jgi:hypothetical protein